MYPESYIFNHVPKTGGTSIMAICRHNLPASEISPHLNEDGILFAPERIKQYRFIAGHFSLLCHNRIAGNRYSLTVLRDPIQTILSLYAFWRVAPDSNPFTQKAKELCFAEFVRFFENAPAIICNRFTHHFAGNARDCPGYFRAGSSLVAAAKHNLSAFDFVGIHEEFDLSMELLCRELGWQLPAPVPHLNRTRIEGQSPEIDKGTMDILRKRNQLDFKLYAYGVELFHRRREACSNWKPGRYARRLSFSSSVVPFGSGRKAYIRSVSATLAPGMERSLEVVVRFHANVSSPDIVVGIAINRNQGREAWGTNTIIEKVPVQIERGSDGCVAFLLQFEGPEGRYFVTAALHEIRRAGFHDHWVERAAYFEVLPKENQPPGAFRIGVRQVRFMTP